MSRRLIYSSIVFLVSALWLSALEIHFKPQAIDGYRFQVWSSDDLMSSIPSSQLRKTPFKSLLYQKFHPPLFDGIRAFITQFYKDSSPKDLKVKVDECLYVLWIIIYGLIAAILFYWAAAALNLGWASLVVFIWIFHPAPIFYGTLLEPTFLSSILLLLLTWHLSSLKPKHLIAISVLSALLFYSRPTFQWYFLLIVAAVMFLRKYSRKQLAIYLGLMALLVGPFMVKQYYFFGTTDSTVVGGYHRLGLLWYYPTEEEIRNYRGEVTLPHYPEDADKYTVNGYQNKDVAIDNLALTKLATDRMKSHTTESLRGVLKSFKQNWAAFWLPSIVYTNHTITDRLPWADYYNKIFGYRKFLALLMLSMIIWVYRTRKDFIFHVAPSLPIFFFIGISLLANRYHWTEAVRYKFTVEPLLYLLCTTQIFWLAIQTYQKWIRSQA